MIEALPRLPKWRARFSSYLIEVAGKPFEWGAHDCALHPADGVLAITGVDLAADFRGRYTTEIGAAKALKRHGSGDLASTFAAKMPEIDPAGARVGDVVIFDGPFGETGGLRLPSCISAITPVGRRSYGLDLVTRAFQVGVR
jgi:hypothetical protein